MAMTETEKKEARKARRIIQRAAKKAGMSTKDYRAQLESDAPEMTAEEIRKEKKRQYDRDYRARKKAEAEALVATEDEVLEQTA